jgi:hypothetical protein
LPTALRLWLHGDGTNLQRTSAQIAERLDSETDPVARYFLWAALGDAWAVRCRPKQTAPAEVHCAGRGA